MLSPRIERVDGLFVEGEEQVFHLIERIVAPLGLRVDESCPYVDARLSDGSRVNAIIPPFRSAARWSPSASSPSRHDLADAYDRWNDLRKEFLPVARSDRVTDL